MKAGWSAMLAAVILTGCAGGGGQSSEPTPERKASAESSSGSGGERYSMSGDAYPQQPPDVSRVPDAQPRIEPPSRGGNRSTYQVWGKTYQVLPDARGYTRQGVASWYGEKFHGYATSNGEIYDMYKMSAAHRSLPLPTFARVTSLDNDRSVIVRINDRGPFHSDREIDLSYAAAARLDILDNGTGRVKVEAIDAERWIAENGGAVKSTLADSRSAPVASSGAEAQDGPSVQRAEPAGTSTPSALYLQVAALGSEDNARALKAKLQDRLSRPVRIASQTGMHRVQVGPLANADQVEPMRDALRRAGFEQAILINGAE
ncbi:septal ring lytic transglycosylase RlpA family protein [Halomonas urumqiensis]|uniref:Endolytic peptidoglycan transglycosylase RlpA n=1 Tax=Halomonas urumqiensis TaxID=1684789 RepID=A0A2N7UFN7_9GAMM|nr:septal ring lytic transglycosylase RlpA family protein [Halomonas urumqiensis]PMR79215.1 septal ring lytic transglycosylase RlpA [Halomonas urumqiensis]PTB03890.1 septal ring lytic transglycosylase RlpA family protein [Halomonas urumqiensis]GHE19870.1 endolytic peptidoglycan transglycosylase RlpA [Halomonas urumqiensis]